MTDKLTQTEIIINKINSGAKCDENCIGHKLYTHNVWHTEQSKLTFSEKGNK